MLLLAQSFIFFFSCNLHAILPWIAGGPVSNFGGQACPPTTYMSYSRGTQIFLLMMMSVCMHAIFLLHDLFDGASDMHAPSRHHHVSRFVLKGGCIHLLFPGTPFACWSQPQGADDGKDNLHAPRLAVFFYFS